MNRRQVLAGSLLVLPIPGCLDLKDAPQVDIVENDFDDQLDIEVRGVEITETATGDERLWIPVTITNASEDTVIVQVGAEFYADDSRLLTEDPPIDLGRELAPADDHQYTPSTEEAVEEVTHVALRIVKREDGIPPN